MKPQSPATTPRGQSESAGAQCPMPPCSPSISGGLPILLASLAASLSPVLTSAVLLASLAACLSPVLPLPGRPQLCLPSLPALLPTGQGTGLGSHLAPTPHSHPRPRLQESLRCFWKPRPRPAPGSPIHWPGPGPVAAPPQLRQHTGAEDWPAATAPQLLGSARPVGLQAARPPA